MHKFVIGCVAAAAVAIGGVGTASAQGESETAPNCEFGLLTAIAAPGADERSLTATTVLIENFLRCGGLEEEIPS